MGSSVPASSSSQTFQAYTPNELDWLKFGLQQQMQGLQMQYYTPMLKDTLQKRKLYKGVMDADPESLRQFAGMPKGATNQQVMDMIRRRQGVNPNVPPAIQPNPQMPGGAPNAKQGKAAGGIMQAKRYAEGGKPGLNPEQAQFLKKMADLKAKGQEPTEAQKKRLNTIETKTGRDVSPYTDVGTLAPGNKGVLKNAQGLGAGTGKSAAGGTGAGEAKAPPPPNPYSYLGSLGDTYGVSGDPNDPTKPITTTDPWVNKTLDYLNNMQSPSEWNQAAGMYKDAYSGLGSLTNYQPQNVSAQQASAQQAAATQMGAIADVNAERVNAGQYKVNASQMKQPKDVTAQQLQRYQMGETAPVTTKDLEAFQMAGPGSWTDEGVSSKYMSPYMQGVIDISKREAERDYLKQANALNAKAISAGAFGGSRQALERAEAQRNYNQQLQDMQVKGLQQAYESGRSQYGQELSLGQQAALQNLQSKLSTQSQSSQQALQAMLANQNVDYQTKLQNLQAMLGVQGQEAQQMLQAALANQQVAFGTEQTNAQLAQQAALANAQYGMQGDLANQQAALQAALANQQTQFGVGSFNAGAQNQASLTNAQLGTSANLANANNALQASMANQQAGLAGAQLGLGAYNAMGNMAQGLGYLGNQNAGWQQQTLGNLQGAGNFMMGLGQQYRDRLANQSGQVVGGANLSGAPAAPS